MQQDTRRFIGTNNGSSDVSESCPVYKARVSIMRDTIYDAMINTVIQSLEPMTRDVREMIRFAKMLWPKYISPLDKGTRGPEMFLTLLGSKQTSEEETTKTCTEIDCKHCSRAKGSTSNGLTVGDVLQELDIQAQRYIRQLVSRCLFMPGQTLDETDCSSIKDSALASSPNIDKTCLATKLPLSYMAKFLLLSGFLCQSNKPDHDRDLYTEKRKGRRKKSKRLSTEQNDVENVAFASSSDNQQQQKAVRQATFPLERAFSVFSSILSNFGTQSQLLQNKCQENGRLDVSDIGTLRLFDCFTELRDFGLFKEVSSLYSAGGENPGSFDMTAPKYICILAEEEAEKIA